MAPSSLAASTADMVRSTRMIGVVFARSDLNAMGSWWSQTFLPVLPGKDDVLVTGEEYWILIALAVRGSGISIKIQEEY